MLEKEDIDITKLARNKNINVLNAKNGLWKMMALWE